jgi:divalent metal cation (Fe/Co/Zn/Cd) transporter
MHINVDGNKTLNEAHDICDKATEKLEALPEVDRAYVHVEPLGYL